MAPPPPQAEDEAHSEASEWELRERCGKGEERKVEDEEPEAGGELAPAALVTFNSSETQGLKCSSQPNRPFNLC
jgi:hypothetical protein